MGHMTYDGHQRGYEGDLSRNAVTIAEALRPAGYRTYMSGKWHVTLHDGRDSPTHNWPLQRGFDRFYGTIKGGGSFYDPTSLTRGNTFITPENDAEYKPPQFYYTDAISDNAIAFLREHSRGQLDRPFFLYVAYTAAHWPMHALPEDIAKYHGKYDGGYGPVRQARLERARQLGLIDARWPLTAQAEDWDQVWRPGGSQRELPLGPKSTHDSSKPPNNEAGYVAWEARCMEVYAAMVDRMDQGVGRIVAELQRQGALENTLLLFLQDNGGCAEPMGRQSNAGKIKEVTYKPFGPDDLQPQIWPPMQTRDGRPVRTGPDVMPGPADTYIAYGRGWANVSNTPFREYKHWVHEGGISTPLILHWPAGIAAERRHGLVRDPGHLIDIMATCVDVAGATYPAEWRGETIQPPEGVSLRPAFAGQPLARPQPIFWEHEGNRAVRDGKWKLVAKGPAAPWELYDMEADRTETCDLADKDPALVQKLKNAWEAWAQRANVIPWIWKPAYGARPEAAKRKP